MATDWLGLCKKKNKKKQQLNTLVSFRLVVRKIYSFRCKLLLSVTSLVLHTLHGRLWLSGRTRVLLSDDRWLNSPGLHVTLSLSKILNPRNCSQFAARHHAPCRPTDQEQFLATAISVTYLQNITL